MPAHHRSDMATVRYGRPTPLWRNRDYAGWWTASLVSAVGVRLTAISLPLLFLYTTGSLTHAGIVAGTEAVGSLVALLVGGAVSDRIPRRAVLVAAPIAQCAAQSTVMLAVVAGRVNIIHIAMAGLVIGAAAGISHGAILPAMRRIVHPEQYPTVTAALHAREMAAMLIGPAVGGVLFTASHWLPFLITTVSYLVAAMAAAMIRTPLGPDGGDRPERRSRLADLAEGLRFVQRSATLKFLAVWAAVVNAAAAGMILLVVSAVTARGAGPAVVGAVGSMAAVGGVTGALAAPVLIRRIPGRMLMILGASALTAGSLSIAYVPQSWQVGVLAAGIMALTTPLGVAIECYQLAVVPDELMGRVLSTLAFFSGSLLWVAPVMAGAAADVFGPTVGLVGCAAAFGALGVWAIGARAAHALGGKPAFTADSASKASE